jgi:small-conductance mechanosensitive channel
MRSQPSCPTLGCLLTALLCDAAGVALFSALFIFSRHWLIGRGVTLPLVLLSANVLIRWRISVLVLRILLRPREPVARPIALPDAEAQRLMRFLSATILAVIILIAFGRYGLADEDSGAPHVIGLIVAGCIAGLYALAVFRVRALAEALIRGNSNGLLGAFRNAVARAWIPIGLTATAGLFVSFVFGLSLGLLSYYRAALSTLAVLLVLLVLEQLTSLGAGDAPEAVHDHAGQADMLVQRSLRRILGAVVLLIAAMAIIWSWVDAFDLPAVEESHALRSTVISVLTVFVAYIAWELARMAIDRSLPEPAGPKLPGGDNDEEAAPGSRLQTILPLTRAAFGAVIAVVAALTVLSRLGVDTAPLIAGAGVFGLAISFGSQSLVRDIISGLFYIWDDAFRVGEYIDTGRLRGTVEALGIRSMKLRHHNGPLHTIPYGQLGAVTNLSRDFATMKFNLRLEPGTDIELVRKTAKRIGIDMQQDPEIASEVILPLKMQGISEIADNAIVVRFKFTVRPIKPTWVQREYLKRMYAVFAEKGIRFAVGALTLRGAPQPAAEASPDPGTVLFPEPMPAASAAPAARVA